MTITEKAEKIMNKPQNRELAFKVKEVSLYGIAHHAVRSTKGSLV